MQAPFTLFAAGLGDVYFLLSQAQAKGRAFQLLLARCNGLGHRCLHFIDFCARRRTFFGGQRSQAFQLGGNFAFLTQKPNPEVIQFLSFLGVSNRLQGAFMQLC
jgi:hypothetical protein